MLNVHDAISTFSQTEFSAISDEEILDAAYGIQNYSMSYTHYDDIDTARDRLSELEKRFFSLKERTIKKEDVEKCGKKLQLWEVCDCCSQEPCMYS